MRIEEQTSKTGLKIKYYVVLNTNNRIILITKNSQIARSVITKESMLK